MNDLLNALIGAIEMLHNVSEGKTYSALEYMERLSRYKAIALKKKPALSSDPYFRQFFK